MSPVSPSASTRVSTSGPTPAPTPVPARAVAKPEADAADAACALTVLYDGACPLCRREIGLYQDQAARHAPNALRFVDVQTVDDQTVDATAAQPTLPANATREQLLARFHVQQADGSLLSGARAFTALWAQLPGWRWLARLARVPGVTPLLEASYRGFLHLRPTMQRVAGAFEPATLHVPRTLTGELRSDHAGETGAVWIYRGILAVSRDAGVRDFARRHLATEQEHLALITPLLPWPQRSRLLVPWRIAGFFTGALPALFGPRAVYGTIAAVETFVDTHYQQQLDQIDALPAPERAAAAPLRALLQRCQADECHHRDEAQALQGRPPGWLLRAWCGLVGRGSAAAVVVARRI